MATMLPDGRRLGAHLPVADGMVKAAERAVEIGASTLQVFSDNPTAWDRRGESSPEIPAFRDLLARHDIAPLVIHGSYLINLAGDDDAFHEGSVRLLAAELEAARRFKASYINIHAGSHRGTGLDAGIDRLVDGIAAALAAEESTGDEAAPIVTLENSSGGGGGIGVDVAELTAIAAALERGGVPRGRIAFCLDIAHLWGAGADLTDPQVLDRLLGAFADEIGLDRLPLIHLNDTKVDLGSRMDRHEHLGAGRIGPEGIASVLRHRALLGAAYIIETPGMDEGYDAINLGRAVALARGEPLEPLPPGALSLRGSRSRATAARRRVADEPVAAVASGENVGGRARVEPT